MTPTYDRVQPGDPLPEGRFPIDRARLIAYAGASGDHNVIHWNERVARAVGLPDVIAHGMATMALAMRVVTDWAGDPAALLSCSVRFSRPVVVPDDDSGALLVVTGSVRELLGDARVGVVLRASVGEDRVLSSVQAVVRLA